MNLSTDLPTDLPADLPIVRPDWNAPAHVQVVSTTRQGGVSRAPYDSLNLGLHVGDEPASVDVNRRRLAEVLELPSAPHWLNQVHGTRVVERRSEEGLRPASTEHGEADGAWCDACGLVVAIMTADCLPVVVCDGEGRRVAACHAGWRGLAAGVLDATLAVFPPASTLHVWLGPAIGPAAFEVGEEVRQAFIERDAAQESAFVATASTGKYHADIYALARQVLVRSGRDIAVSGGGRCTVSEVECFHSHRRDGVRSGRMATLAWLDPPLAAPPLTS